jgi:cytochrome c-type biogenesis protein
MTGWELGYGTALLAGVISFISPCVLPLVPGYLSFIAGESAETLRGPRPWVQRLGTLGPALLFVLGFAAVFVVLGAGASAVGGFLLRWKNEAAIVGGIFVAVFGLLMTGWLRPGWLLREYRLLDRVPAIQGPLPVFGLGVAFGFGWTPCIGPILGGILTLAAASGNTGTGMVLLAVYAAGLGVPFLLAALFVDWLATRTGAIARHGHRIRVVAGVLMIAMGVALATGYVTALAYWLLETFPMLGRIG